MEARISSLLQGKILLCFLDYELLISLLFSAPGEMMYIINQPENRTELTQLVKVTVCHREGEPCYRGGLTR